MQVPSSSRVLLAPDSALCRRVGGVLFRAGEFSCRTVLTGEGLDRVLAWWRPTAVVLWPGLPGSDGVSLLATIRHYSAELPVLVLTRGLDNGQLIAHAKKLIRGLAQMVLVQDGNDFVATIANHTCPGLCRDRIGISFGENNHASAHRLLPAFFLRPRLPKF